MKFSIMRCLAAIAGLLVCAPLSSQEFRASLSGRVTDPSGAAISAANIAVRSNATGDTLQAVTDEDGRYQIPFLNPGEYTVTAEKSGFQKSIQQGLSLQVAERSTLDIRLTIGEVN